MIAQIDLMYLNNSEEFFTIQGSCTPEICTLNCIDADESPNRKAIESKLTKSFRRVDERTEEVI